MSIISYLKMKVMKMSHEIEFSNEEINYISTIISDDVANWLSRTKLTYSEELLADAVLMVVGYALKGLKKKEKGKLKWN